MDYIETYDNTIYTDDNTENINSNTIYTDDNTEDIDDMTLFYFIFTMPNFTKNMYVIKRIQIFIENYKKLNGYTM